MTTLEQLPDDVLVAVMQDLSVRDLFSCRLVCKRLGTVALNPDVWRHRRLTEDMRDVSFVRAVLSLAPCLESAVFSRKVRLLAVVFSTTRCAVRELVLDVRVKKKRTLFAQRALAVLRNQMSLGRLRRVELRLSFSGRYSALQYDKLLKQAAAVDALLNAMVSCSDLESIDLPLGVDEIYRFSPALDGPLRPSLKYFRCAMNQHSERFVNTVLASHAATLEEVDLIGVEAKNCWDFFYKDSAGPMAGLSNLRRLRCHAFSEMKNLTACKMLTDLCIIVEEENDTRQPIINGTAVFLRAADQLRTVSITGQFFVDGSLADVLLQALPPGVERLTLLSMNSDSVEPLLRALPRLPALRHLQIPEVKDDVIRDLLPGITPDTAPALRRLEVESVLSTDCFCDCKHDWLHWAAVKAFLTLNPSVHIHVREVDDCDGKYCDWCPKDSEPAVCRIPEGRHLGLFAHGPGDCLSPGDHATGSAWAWIHIDSLPDSPLHPKNYSDYLSDYSF